MNSRISESAAQEFVDFFKQPGVPLENNIRLHVDMGVENPNPAGHPSLTEWGNWGGANEVPVLACDRSYMASNRNMFHLGIARPLTTGGSGAMGHWCFVSAKDGRTLAHELGHNMNLTHSGSRLSGQANTKAVYESPMNYSYTYVPSVVSFGVNKFSGVVVNPTGINETTWQGSNNASLALLQPGVPNGSYEYLVVGKALDWNQDNLIQDSATNVLAKINAPAESGHMRGATFGPTPTDPNGYETDPTLVRLNDGAGSRLYMFTRSLPTPSTLMRRYSTNVETACSVYGNPWATCATWTAKAVVPGTLDPLYGTTSRASAVAKFVAGSTSKLMVVYADASGYLKFLTMHLSGANEVWSPLAFVDATAVTTGAPAAAWDSVAGRVDVYAISGGALKRWSYNVATTSWDILATAQTWSTGGNVAPTAGLGLAWGYQKGSSSQHLYALVPYGTSAVMDHARRSPSVANQWEKLAATNGSTDTRPGFVYRPYQNGTGGLQSGRFMYLIRDLVYGGTPTVGITEGNDPNGGASYQRLSVWKKGYFAYELDKDLQSAETLFYEPGVDSSVRGARSTDGSSVQFGPLADGLVNYGFRDYHDYAALKANAGCGVGGYCRYCQGLNADGTCTSFNVTEPDLP